MGIAPAVWQLQREVVVTIALQFAAAADAVGASNLCAFVAANAWLRAT